MLPETLLATSGAYLIYSVAQKNNPLSQIHSWRDSNEVVTPSTATKFEHIAQVQKRTKETNDFFNRAVQSAPSMNLFDSGAVPPRTVSNVLSERISSFPRTDGSRRVSGQSKRATTTSNRPWAHPQVARTVPINLAEQTWPLQYSSGQIVSVPLSRAATMGNPKSRLFPKSTRGSLGIPKGAQWLVWNDSLVERKREYFEKHPMRPSRSPAGVDQLQKWDTGSNFPQPSFDSKKRHWHNGPVLE